MLNDVIMDDAIFEESRILKEFKEKDAFWKTDKTFDWPVKYSMKQMHCEIPGVISNNFLSQISDEQY